MSNESSGLVVTTLVLAASFASLAGLVDGATATVRLAAFGDTIPGTPTAALVTAAVNDGARGLLGLGDYGESGSTATALATLAPLTSRGAYLVLGNHDDAGALATLMPHGAIWSLALGGMRFVGADTNQRLDVGSSQYAFVRAALCGAPESLRVLVLHSPWWLLAGAVHPGGQFPGSPGAMDRLVADCGVDLVLAAHEQNYQRMIRNGITYVIAGTGGAASYPLAGMPSDTVATFRGTARLMIDVAADGIGATLVSLDGATRDAFRITSPTSPPAVAFTSVNGNEWWAQVRLSGADAPRVVQVAAMDTGGPWVALGKMSWGDWAGSFHVESGHLVQYRATLVDGRTATSCWFTHPGGGCASGGTAAFGAKFFDVRGTVWWVETEVTVTGGTLVGVDARVNGGSWVALAHTTWGSWAKSIYAPAGSHVEFRARATDGATALSVAYLWPP